MVGVGMMSLLTRLLIFVGIFNSEARRIHGMNAIDVLSRQFSREVQLGTAKLLRRIARGGPLTSAHGMRSLRVVRQELVTVQRQARTAAAKAGILSTIFGHGRSLRHMARDCGFALMLLEELK